MSLHISMAPKLLVFLHSKNDVSAAGRYLKADVIPSIASCHILLGEATKASASWLGRGAVFGGQKLVAKAGDGCMKMWEGGRIFET